MCSHLKSIFCRSRIRLHCLDWFTCWVSFQRRLFLFIEAVSIEVYFARPLSRVHLLVVPSAPPTQRGQDAIDMCAIHTHRSKGTGFCCQKMLTRTDTPSSPHQPFVPIHHHFRVEEKNSICVAPDLQSLNGKAFDEFGVGKYLCSANKTLETLRETCSLTVVMAGWDHKSWWWMFW